MSEKFELPDVVDEFLTAVFERDQERIVAAYADDVARFGGGPGWFALGREHVAEEWAGWIADGSARYLEFNWVDGPYGSLGDELGWAGGVAEQVWEKDGVVQGQQIRVSWVFRKHGDGWRIQLEHYSRPLEEPYTEESSTASFSGRE